MTNHDRFSAVFQVPHRRGQKFSAREVRETMLAESDITPGSILPNDHADGNKSPCQCARNKNNSPIFDREDDGGYRVR
jgi:hypothetical protein